VCFIISKDKQMFNENEKLIYGQRHRRHSRLRGRASTPIGDLMF